MKCFFLHAGEPEAVQLAEQLHMPHGRKLPAKESYQAVIRYGTLAPEPAEPVVLGRLVPILRATKARLAADLLLQCGMKIGGALEQALRREDAAGRSASASGQSGGSKPTDGKGKAGGSAGTGGGAQPGEGSWRSGGARPNEGSRQDERGRGTNGGRPGGSGWVSEGERQGRGRAGNGPWLGESGRASAGAAVSPPVYEYEVPVFHTQALAVYERRLGLPNPGILMPRHVAEFREIEFEEGHFHSKRAIREALRAIYALGLDYGLVRLEIGAKGDTRITAVDPCPDWTGRGREKWVEAMNAFAGEEWPDYPNLLLGADPEFILMRADGRVVPASKFMDREGKVGCDAVVLSGHRVILPLAELRPDPSPSPAGLVRNLRRVMLSVCEKVPDEELAWLAGGMPVNGLALGGHIHFSGIPLTAQLLRALDNYVALPVMLAEGEESRRRRPRYGRLGDCRRKRHGGFEYRSLPSWLATPELATGVLALARVVALHWRELREDPLQHSGLRRLFYRGETERLAPVARKLWTQLKTLPAYREHSRELEPLEALVFGDKPLAWSGDFRAAWGIDAEVYADIHDRKRQEQAARSGPKALLYV